MKTGEICNKINLTAQDWWEYYVQNGCLNKQPCRKSIKDSTRAIAFFFPKFLSVYLQKKVYLGKMSAVKYGMMRFFVIFFLTRQSPLSPSFWNWKWLTEWFIDVWRDRMLVIQCREHYICTKPSRPQVYDFCRIQYKQGSAVKRLSKSYAWTRLLLSQLTN